MLTLLHGTSFSRSIGRTYGRYIPQVGIYQSFERPHIIEEVRASRFHSWETNICSEIDQLWSLPYHDPYKAHKAPKFLEIG
jgi:hypothetical protein